MDCLRLKIPQDDNKTTNNKTIVQIGVSPMQLQGTIAKAPAIRDKVIFSAIKADNIIKPIQIVLFRKNRDAALTEFLSNAKLGDRITITGRTEKNPYNNETQIIIDDIVGAVKEIPMPSVF